MDAYDIFVSYSHEDRPRVKILVAALAAEGWEVFWDRTIPPGESWRTFIGAPLAAAPIVIVCWSKYSVESDWVCQEADAAAKRKVLLPVMLDPVTPPLGLAHVHAADLVEWIGESGAKLPAVLKLAILRKLPGAGTSGAPRSAPSPAPVEVPPPVIVRDPPRPLPTPTPSPAGMRRTGFYSLVAAGAAALVAALAVGGYFAFSSKPIEIAKPSIAGKPPDAAKPAEIGLLSQAETRDATGKITTEAATIHVIACGGSGGEARGIYVYEYINRRVFRAIQPPNWSTALGGREFPNVAEAMAAGCAAPAAALVPLGAAQDGWSLSSGDILRYYGSPSEAACRADCEREAVNCQAFTWVKPGGYTAGDPPMCYLMRTYKTATQHKCCTTATRGPFPGK